MNCWLSNCLLIEFLDKLFKTDELLAFKLLECSDLEMKDRQFVLIGVDYDKTTTLFKQMSISLRRYCIKGERKSGGAHFRYGVTL